MLPVVCVVMDFGVGGHARFHTLLVIFSKCIVLGTKLLTFGF